MLSQSAGATGCGGLLVIDGNASSRCGISMKGIDIVVKGSVGHMSAFMAQAGNLVVLGDAGDALGDFALRGAALRARQGEEPRRRLHREGDARRAHGDARQAARAMPGLTARSIRRSSAATARRAQLYNFHIDNAGGLLMGGTKPAGSHTPPRNPRPSTSYTIAEIHRAAATGIYDIRGFGAKRKVPAFRRSAVPRRLDLPLSARRLSREMRDRRDARHALRQEADPSQDSDHHRRHELRLAVGARPRRRSAAAPRSSAPPRRPATAA